MRRLEAALHGIWQTRGVASRVLWPLSLSYRAVVACRRALYRSGWKTAQRFDVPVIVVGNISVGGTGKTPVVIALVQRLLACGFKPGVVSRGYGGGAREWPQDVDASSSPAVVGDEPVLVARRTRSPVVVGPDRVAAVRQLLARHGCDAVVADDGLQHLALHRDVEIAVVDGERRFGNGFCLPAGPLREPQSRLRSVDFVLYNGGNGRRDRFTLTGDVAVNLTDSALTRPLADFRNGNVHAVAGIGSPDRFFAQLRGAGLDIVEHAFPDHHLYVPSDLEFADRAPVLMTEKDGVKCSGFATATMWQVPVDAELDDHFFNQLKGMLKRHDR